MKSCIGLSFHLPDESGPRFAWHTYTRNRRRKNGVVQSLFIVPLNVGHCAMCASIGLWAVTSRSFIYAGKLLLMSLAKYQTAFNQHMYAYLPWPALLFAALITALRPLYGPQSWIIYADAIYRRFNALCRLTPAALPLYGFLLPGPLIYAFVVCPWPTFPGSPCVREMGQIEIRPVTRSSAVAVIVDRTAYDVRYIAADRFLA